MRLVGIQDFPTFYWISLAIMFFPDGSSVLDYAEQTLSWQGNKFWSHTLTAHFSAGFWSPYPGLKKKKKGVVSRGTFPCFTQLHTVRGQERERKSKETDCRGLWLVWGGVGVQDRAKLGMVGLGGGLISGLSMGTVILYLQWTCIKHQTWRTGMCGRELKSCYHINAMKKSHFRLLIT